MNIFTEKSADSGVIASLSTQVFGKSFPNMLRAANLLREFADINREYSFVIKNDEGKIVASLRNWQIEIACGSNCLWETGWLLGPILVAPHLRGEGWGRALIKHTIENIPSDDILVTIGDPGYFAPQGFTVLLPANIHVEGEVAPLSVMVKGKRQDIHALRAKGRLV